MAARFFLGLVESIIGPVFVIVTGNWWTRSEQAFRTAFWLSGTPVRYQYPLEDTWTDSPRSATLSVESCHMGWDQVSIPAERQ